MYGVHVCTLEKLNATGIRIKRTRVVVMNPVNAQWMPSKMQLARSLRLPIQLAKLAQQFYGQGLWVCRQKIP
eukprot:COSAG02_NODE_201_length_29473_cov_135.510213_12_plen_72_part_00